CARSSGYAWFAYW
nr:immunoglobulin heavy chain junction region [Mus musculus]